MKEHGEAFVRFLERDEACHRLIVEGRVALRRSRGEVARRRRTRSRRRSRRPSGIVVFCDPLYDTPYAGRGAAWQTELTRFLADEARARGQGPLARGRLRAAAARRLEPARARRRDRQARDVRRDAAADRHDRHRGGRRRHADVAGLPAGRVDRVRGPRRRACGSRPSCSSAGAGEASGPRRVTDDGGITMMLIGATAQKLRKVGTVLDLVGRGASVRRGA